MTGGRIIGWGTALPEKVLTNDDLSTMMDTNDEWITERTGIKRRHIGGSTASSSPPPRQIERCPLPLQRFKMNLGYGAELLI